MALSEGWTRLHPLSPLVLAGRYALAAMAGLFQAAQDQLLGGTEGMGIAVRLAGVLLLVALVALAYAAASWRVRAYRVTDELVELKTGLLFRSHRHLPFDRIESVDMSQSLIPRLLGLAEVRVEAVSEHGSELRLRYLARADAERLRIELSERHRRGAGGTGVVAPIPETAILQVPVRELLVGYLIVPLAFLVAAAIIAGVLVLAAGGSWLELVLVGFGASATVVPALLLRVERIWGFRLDDAHDALVINRGLLNLQTQRISAGRIQAVQVEQPPLWRLLRRFRVTADVAGYRGVDRDAARAAANLLPIAPEEVVRYVLHRLELNIDLAGLEHRTVPERAKWRSPLRWRSFQIAWAETNAVTRSGVLWRRTVVVPYARIQSARVTQGPWQRRLRLATVHLDTAGARIRAAARHRETTEAVDLAQEALKQLARRADPSRGRGR